ncbi:MAG: 2-oxoglutarate dehydrogenase complex dihydrolipoyllysine-residue succinyltransferase [Gemmataceae bacterium]|nr:2-oxoglutarate dehydrogenase complex dihydrolipoyllysine-residue succinyltransferase [Gemmataceae bacterium]
MAAVEIKVTPAGESVTQATVSRWLKPDGAYVKNGEAVCELETDKAGKEEYAPAAGVLSIKAQPGARVAIGEVIGTIDPSAKPKEEPTPAGAPPVKEVPKDVPKTEPRQSPAARVMIDTAGLDAGRIAPGPKGVITKGDVIAHQEEKEEKPAAAPPPTAVPVKPAGGETRQKLSPMRQRIAERLLQAQEQAAILTTFNEADMSRVMELRAKYKDAFQKKHGVGLGFMSFFVKAVVEALRAFPAVNAFIEGDEVVYHHYHHIGVAVSTEKGLMVPVLRNCESLSFAGVEKGIAELAVKARDGKIALSDLQGGTFTITNGGVFGSLLSTPILNPPQSGILGMHTIQKRPVVVDDQIVIRPMMYLALSYDHRMIDGKEAVSFLVRVKEGIESPERLLIEV